MVIGPVHPVMTPTEIDDLLAYMERCSLDRMVTMNYTGWPPTLEGCVTANRNLAATVRRVPDRIVPIAWVNPTMGTAMFDLYRACAEEHGFAGCKVWLTNKADDPVMNPYVEYNVRHKRLTMIHTWYRNRATAPLERPAAPRALTWPGNTVPREAWSRESWPEDVIKLAKRYPEAAVLQMHYGGSAFEAGLVARHAPKNVYQVCSSLDATGSVELQVKYLGARRVLWGTDGWRWSNRGLVTGAELSDEEKRLVLGENIARLLAGDWGHSE